MAKRIATNSWEMAYKVAHFSGHWPPPVTANHSPLATGHWPSTHTLLVTSNLAATGPRLTLHFPAIVVGHH